jgi:hypothetical protein
LTAAAAAADVVFTALACPGTLAAKLSTCAKLTTKDTCTGECGWVGATTTTTTPPPTHRRALLEDGMDDMDCVPRTVADMINSNSITDVKSVNDATKLVEQAAELMKLMASFVAAGDSTHGTCDAATTLREIMAADKLCATSLSSTTCDPEKCVKSGFLGCDVKPSWLFGKLAASQGEFTTKVTEASTACAAFTTASACTTDKGKIDDAAIKKAADYLPPTNGARAMSQGLAYVAAVAGAMAYFLMM